jgi:CheY-like chemotaxis protein
VTDTNAPGQPAIAVLSRDVFFGMRIRNALKQLGYTLALVGSEADLAAAMGAAPALAMVDFNTPIDWDAVAAAIADHSGVPVLAFGAHTDTEGFRLARAAGATRVIANRSLSQQLPDLIARYDRTA